MDDLFAHLDDTDDSKEQTLNVEQQKLLEYYEAVEAGVLSNLLATEAGRQFIWSVLGMCRSTEISFSSDPLLTAFREGHRNVGNKLLQKVFTSDPSAYSLMAAESKARSEGLAELGEDEDK